MNKEQIRTHWRDKRRGINDARRRTATQKAQKQLPKALNSHSHILSYASLQDEFDTSHINQMLAKTGKLLLPKVIGEELHIYHVESPESQLAPNKWGVLEPIPALCKKADLSQIACVLVPGIVFDTENHRLGYGKGYYDRFLTDQKAETYGLGFKEQLSRSTLPVTKHDVALKGLFLY